jgi:hypothetical protein
MLKNILYLLNYFQTYFDVTLMYLKDGHTNITNNFHVILIYESFKNVKKGLVTPKVTLISMV